MQFVGIDDRRLERVDRLGDQPVRLEENRDQAGEFMGRVSPLVGQRPRIAIVVRLAFDDASFLKKCDRRVEVRVEVCAAESEFETDLKGSLVPEAYIGLPKPEQSSARSPPNQGSRA